MAYQHHPQAPAPKPARSLAGAHAAGIALALMAVIAGGAWYLLREGDEAPATMTVAQVDAGTPVAEPMAPPVPVGEARQSETIRGTLILPGSSERLIRAEELAGLSREQLQRARAEILARAAPAEASSRVSGGEPAVKLSEIEAANLRLIEQAEKAR
jgi:hypothetical protein